MNLAIEIAQATESRSGANDPTARIRSLFTTVLRREPVPAEIDQFTDFVNPLQQDQIDATFPSGWSYGYGTIDDTQQAVTQSVGDSVQRIWNSEEDFGDSPAAQKLSAWAQLAQTLLLTNEFVFVD